MEKVKHGGDHIREACSVKIRMIIIHRNAIARCRAGRRDRELSACVQASAIPELLWRVPERRRDSVSKHVLQESLGTDSTVDDEPR
jgi:hypothetical protein